MCRFARGLKGKPVRLPPPTQILVHLPQVMRKGTSEFGDDDANMSVGALVCGQPDGPLATDFVIYLIHDFGDGSPRGGQKEPLTDLLRRLRANHLYELLEQCVHLLRIPVRLALAATRARANPVVANELGDVGHAPRESFTQHDAASFLAMHAGHTAASAALSALPPSGRPAGRDLESHMTAWPAGHRTGSV